MKNRCWKVTDPIYIEYHDKEWGVPVHDDRLLFEFLILEGAQAGLSWSTILNKRENFRAAFDNFDIQTVAGYGEEDIERLLADPGIIRNRRKVFAAVRNARCALEIIDEHGSLDSYLWRFVNGRPIDHRFESLRQMPAYTEESEAMSKELKSKGMNFVGPTICYSFMQAVGMVNDHLLSCFRHDEIQRMIF